MSTNSSTTESLVDSVKTNLASSPLAANDTTVVVGFSGGADSTALLIVLHELRYRICAVHLQHGLRGEEGEADADWCEQFCRQRGIAFDCDYLAVRENKHHNENIEAAARRLRLDFWRTYLQKKFPPQQGKKKTAVVALAHHADDVLEDFFLRMMRGSNSSGLTGLRLVREINGVTFIRPLLSCQRQTIESFLIERGINDWRHDSSNRDVSFRRNAVRHRLIPVLNEIAGAEGEAGCRQSIRVLREDAEYLESIAEDYSRNLDQTTDFINIPSALQSRVLRKWVYHQTGRDYIPSAAAMHRIRREARRDIARSRSIPLKEGLVLIMERGNLKINTVAVSEWQETAWEWRIQPVLQLVSAPWRLTAKTTKISKSQVTDLSSASCQFFSLQDFPDWLEVRQWQEGDRMIPFGQRREVKVKEIFQKAKIPRTERRNIPLIIAEGRIIWAVGVCRSALFPVTGERESAVQMRGERKTAG